LIAQKRHADFQKIKYFLTNIGIDVTVEEPIYENNSYTNSEGKLVEYTTLQNSGYVDDSCELYDFLNDICSDENKLKNYLFSDLSFIKTGNDNDDSDVDISVSYEHDEYYKGN
jgi:hypothetical protein